LVGADKGKILDEVLNIKPGDGILDFSNEYSAAKICGRIEGCLK